MAWQTVEEIRSVGELAEWVDRVTLNGLSGLLFRGQAKKKWRLEPTSHRVLPRPEDRKMAEVFEREGMFRFRKSAHLYLDRTVMPDWPLPDHMSDVDILVVWSLMRHYRAPTRVLDWTFSPYVATYFAVREKWDADASLWFYDPRALQAAWQHVGLPRMPNALRDFADGGKRHDEIPIVFDYEPSEQIPRMVAQQCRLSVCTNAEDDHERAIERLAAKAGKEDWFGRVAIPAKYKYALFRHLLSMGIDAYSLFPGADGLGESIQEVYKLRAEDLSVLRGREGIARDKQDE